MNVEDHIHMNLELYMEIGTALSKEVVMMANSTYNLTTYRVKGS